MTGRILLVEQDIGRCSKISAFLREEFFEVVVVDNPEFALRRIQAELPGIVLISDSIKGQSPYDLCMQLRRAPRTTHIPVLLISEPHRLDWMQALVSKFDDIFAFPQQPMELIHKIRHLQRRKSDIDALRLHIRTNELEGFGEFRPEDDFIRGHKGRVLVFGEAEDALINSLSRLLDVEVAIQDFNEPIADHEGVSTAIYVHQGELDDTHLAAFAKIGRRPELRDVPRMISGESIDANLIAKVFEMGASDAVYPALDRVKLAVRISSAMRANRFTKRLHRLMSDKMREALTDSLTGLYNRRYAERYLRKALDWRVKPVNDLVVMMLDIDGFKDINDSFGHLAGDEILVQCAHILQKNLRGIDLISRIGGEEFLIVLPSIKNIKAEAIAERLRTQIETTHFVISGQPAPITITMSIGLSSTSDVPATAVDLWQAADRALYAAKGSGRNQVLFYKSAA